MNAHKSCVSASQLATMARASSTVPASSKLSIPCGAAAVFNGSESTISATSTTVVVHVLAPQDEAVPAPPVRVGFVVGKAVGNSVTRSRVQRRLRHLMRDRLDRLPPGTAVVVRALPVSARSGGRTLGADLDHCLSRLGADSASASSLVSPGAR